MDYTNAAISVSLGLMRGWWRTVTVSNTSAVIITIIIIILFPVIVLC